MSNYQEGTVIGSLSVGPKSLSGKVSSGTYILKGKLASSVGRLVGSIRVPEIYTGDVYQGPYEVTPTQSTQVLSTVDLRMNGNVTINPIPSNYGRVIYDGGIRIV